MPVVFKRFTRQKEDQTIRILVWSVPAALFLLLYLVVEFTRRTPPPPGIQTTSVAKEMKQYLGLPAEQLTRRFGMPSHIEHQDTFKGAGYFMYRYDYLDGRVNITIGGELHEVAAIYEQGIEIPSYPEGPTVHQSIDQESRPLDATH